MSHKISLNIPCAICKNKVYLGEDTAHTEKGVYHLECYLNLGEDERNKLKRVYRAGGEGK